MALSQNTNSIVSSYMISRELNDLSCFLLKPFQKINIILFLFFLGWGTMLFTTVFQKKSILS